NWRVAAISAGGQCGQGSVPAAVADRNRSRVSAHNSGTTSRQCAARNQNGAFAVAYLACRKALGGKSEIQVSATRRVGPTSHISQCGCVKRPDALRPASLPPN